MSTTTHCAHQGLTVVRAAPQQVCSSPTVIICTLLCPIHCPGWVCVLVMSSEAFSCCSPEKGDSEDGHPSQPLGRCSLPACSTQGSVLAAALSMDPALPLRCCCGSEGAAMGWTVLLWLCWCCCGSAGAELHPPGTSIQPSMSVGGCRSGEGTEQPVPLSLKDSKAD